MTCISFLLSPLRATARPPQAGVLEERVLRLHEEPVQGIVALDPGDGERDRAAPTAAHHDPVVDAEMHAEPLEVFDETGGPVLPDLRVRRAAPRRSGRTTRQGSISG